MRILNNVWILIEHIVQLLAVSGFGIEKWWRPPQWAQKLDKCVIKCSQYVLFDVYVVKWGITVKLRSWMVKWSRLLMMVRQCQNPTTIYHDQEQM